MIAGFGILDFVGVFEGFETGVVEAWRGFDNV